MNVIKPEEIIFTKNTTESINLVAYSWGNENLKENILDLEIIAFCFFNVKIKHSNKIYYLPLTYLTSGTFYHLNLV